MKKLSTVLIVAVLTLPSPLIGHQMKKINMGAWELIIGLHIPCWIASIVIGYKQNRLIA
jgi:hypothetical protein